MSFRTNAVKIQAFAGALYGIQVGTATMAQVNADIASNGGLLNTLNGYYATAFGSVANATVAASVAANLGLTGDALASGTAYITAQLNAAAPAARGAVISTVLDQFAALTADATFGAAATAWNTKVEAANAYTGATNAAMGATVGQGTAFTLTPGADNIVGTVANDAITALTIRADGEDKSTFSAFDAIDGGAGTDTLNIYTNANNGGYNSLFPTMGSVKNVEIVNIYNIDGGANLADASTFVGVTQLWQHGYANDVTNLAVGTTAGFKTTQNNNLYVEGAATAASVAVALNAVEDGSLGNGNQMTLSVLGNALNTVNVSGSIAPVTTPGTFRTLSLDVFAGKDQKTVTVNTAIDASVSVYQSSPTPVNTLDFTGSAGSVTFFGDQNTTTINSGAGNDKINVATKTAKDDATTAANETITATTTTGAGNDTVTVNVTGDGLTNVDTGTGNDTVSITGRGASVLTVNLGDGSDSFTSATPIAATDNIDAGAGTDTLLLSLVGSVNVTAFKNFDVYDVKGMSGPLDLDILNTANNVTEIVGSAALGGLVTLQNVTTNFRATGDMTGTQLTLTQKTAGALTVTLDADETGTADAGNDTAGVSVAAVAATSVTAAFDTAYLAKAGATAGETAAIDNVSTIELATQAATTINVVSGGAFSSNVLNVTEGSGTDALTSVTVTGAQALTLTVSGASKLASVNASASTGGLTATLATLANGANITLGSGTDKITVTNSSTTGSMESITGFAKTAAVAVSTAAADVAAQAAALAAADVVLLAVATVANAITVAGGAVGTKGVLTFTGAGPTTLGNAIAIAELAADVAGEALVFQYLGNSFVFVQGDTNPDTVVQLTGVTGVTNFVENGTDAFFIV